jgi:3-deoxy-D-manno-octulosonate 8-phosphate phosphatase (KDO 8-P phosphatase)
MSWSRKMRAQLSLTLGPPVSVFVLDVDGVMTDGKFIYDSDQKKYKTFGPDDSDALRILSKHVEIHFTSADFRGFDISRKRIEDIGFNLFLVPSNERLKWISDRFSIESVAYMGDSFQDVEILANVGLGICPANGHKLAMKAAGYVTRNEGGSRAVTDACGFIARRNRIPGLGLC